MARLSNPLFDWRSAITDSELPSTTKLVGLVLALYMSSEGDSCFPSYTTIARKSGLSRRTAIRAVGELVESGWLERETGGPKRSNRYSAAIPGGDTVTPPLVTQFHHSGDTVTPEVVIESVMESVSSTATATTSSEVLAAFNEEAETDFRAARYLTIIEEQISKRPDLSLDEHRRAIRRTLDEKWWKGSPSPDLVYANERAFERALNLTDQQRLSYTRD